MREPSFESMSLKYRTVISRNNQPLRPRPRKRVPMELPHEKLRAWGSIFLCLLALAFYSVLMISPSDFNDIDKDYLGSIIMIVSVTTRSFLGLATECFSKSAQSFFKHPVFIFLRALSDFSIMSCCIYAIISFAASLER